MIMMMMMALLKALAGSEGRFNGKRFGSKGGTVSRKRSWQERRQGVKERSNGGKRMEGIGRCSGGLINEVIWGKGRLGRGNFFLVSSAIPKLCSACRRCDVKISDAMQAEKRCSHTGFSIMWFTAKCVKRCDALSRVSSFVETRVGVFW